MAIEIMKRLRNGILLAAGLVEVAAQCRAGVVFDFKANQPVQSFGWVLGLINPNFVYNPSTQGAIFHIDFSIDQSENPDFTPVPPVPDPARLLILQNGSYYAVMVNGTFPGKGLFTTLSASGLTAVDFGLINESNTTIVDAKHNTLAPGGVDSTVHPDFSATGGPIEFGQADNHTFICGSGDAANLACPFLFEGVVVRQNYLVMINDPTIFSDSTFADLADYNIIEFPTSINPPGAVTLTVTTNIPEPASLALVCLGLVVVALGQWRRRPRQTPPGCKAVPQSR